MGCCISLPSGPMGRVSPRINVSYTSGRSDSSTSSCVRGRPYLTSRVGVTFKPPGLGVSITLQRLDRFTVPYSKSNQEGGMTTFSLPETHTKPSSTVFVTAPI